MKRLTFLIIGIQLCLVLACCAPLVAHGQASISPPVNVIAWGNNAAGQTNVPSDLTNAVAIAAGYDQTIALRSDGTVATWGWGVPGLGTPPPDLTNVTAVAARGLFFAMTDDGRVISWGPGHTPFSYLPPWLTSVVAFAPGANRNLALKSDGTVVDWIGDTVETNLPSGLSNIVAIAAGAHGLALRADGRVFAWGGSVPLATDVPSDLTNVVSIAADNHFSLALKSDGTVVAWGHPEWGATAVPTGLSNVVNIAAGERHAIALRADGTVVAWGAKDLDIDPGPTNAPSVLPYVTAISAGNLHSAVIVNPTRAASPPRISAQPKSQNIAVGSTLLLFVRALGFPPVKYQWYFNKTNLISSATNSVLPLINLQPSDSGDYTVVVSNGAGSTISDVARLSVLPVIDLYLVPAIRLSGGLGSSYQIEFIDSVGPTNAWIPLATVTLTNSSQFYFDVDAIRQPKRFYRLTQVP